MKSIKAEFQNRSGERLAARIDIPASGEYKAFALYAHCFTCTKDIKAAVNLGRTLCRHGIAVMRFDFPGLGESEGDFTRTNFSSNVEDVTCAAEYLEKHYRAPGLLIGHSLGGAAVIKAAVRIGSVRAVATINTPADPGYVKHHFEEELEEISKTGEASVQLMSNKVTMTQQFVDDVDSTGITTELTRLNCALLVLHAPLDKIVNVANAAQLFQQARHPKSFVSLDDADHLLSNRRDAEYAGALIATWASRYLEEKNPPGKK